MEIQLPFIKTPIGAGDVVKAATSAVGVKPCGGCNQRAAQMNRAITFVPRNPPRPLRGWTRELLARDEMREVSTWHNHDTGEFVVKEVIDGRETRSTSYDSRDQAIEGWKEMWL